MRRNFHEPLDDMNGVIVRADGDRERRSFDNSGDHRRIDFKVLDAALVDLEHRGTEILDNLRDAVRSRRGQCDP